MSSVNECVAVLAVCEAPQDLPHFNLVCTVMQISMSAIFSPLGDSDDDSLSHSDETSLAVTTCVQTMPQLKTLVIHVINPLPVLQSLSHRGSPLDSVTVENPHWVCTVDTYSYAISVL